LKIVPATGQDVTEIEEMSLTVKLLPDNDGNLHPVFYMVSPGEDYDVTIMHLRLLIGGLELGISSLDTMISCMVNMMKSNAIESMKEFGFGDNPVELEKILGFIASLENDDEDQS
jgi:hypothetical protein|tara:strand:+ start:2216 stop:2560 length:345 start_codon:yes stop_codon:yes gene_type:complete